VKGFIMINVEPGTEKAVHDCLQGIKGIREVVPVYGEKDFIAILDVESIADLNRAVLNVRDISGVTYTQTILGMNWRFRAGCIPSKILNRLRLSIWQFSSPSWILTSRTILSGLCHEPGRKFHDARLYRLHLWSGAAHHPDTHRPPLRFMGEKEVAAAGTGHIHLHASTLYLMLTAPTNSCSSELWAEWGHLLSGLQPWH